MGNTYKVIAEKVSETVILLKLAFGEAAQNDVIVKDAAAALGELNLQGGETVLLNGPASLPVAIAIGHHVDHLYKEVAVFDPKLGAYVVSVSHGGREIGTLIKV
jgi:CRISPR-associated protein Csx3